MFKNNIKSFFKKLMIISSFLILLLSMLIINCIGTSKCNLNEDGYLNILDMEYLTSFYGERDKSGWIKEDLNNDGDISALDLVLVTNYFDDTWW